MIEQNENKKRRIRRIPNVTDSIMNSRTTIIVNMVIEIFSALVLLIGIIYFFRFMIFFRTKMVDMYFRIFLGASFIFSAGWFSYMFIKIREHYRMLMNSLKEDRIP